MRSFREWIQRLQGTLLPARRDADLEHELRSHMEIAAEDKRRRGLGPDDASRAARIEAGGASQAMDALRDQRGLPWLDDLARDVSHGLRTLRRAPVFTAVALLTLALGIGANTAIFSIVNGVILRPLDYPKPEQLMYLTTDFPALGLTRNPLSVQEYAGVPADQSIVCCGRRRTELWVGPTLRAKSTLRQAIDLCECGRYLSTPTCSTRLAFSRRRDASSARKKPIAPGAWRHRSRFFVYELWQTVFAGQPLVGQTVNVEGRPHEILGIMPSGIDVMDNRSAIWLPLGLPAAIRQNRSFHILHVIGRLRDGVTAQAAQTELNAFLENWAERAGSSDHVPTNRPSRAADHTLRIEPLQDAIVGDARSSIWILQVAVGFVLLIACANLANLLMARAESRRREFAVRAALGASRSRLLRQTMTEGVMLCVAGGMLGLWLAHVAVQALIRAYPTSVPRMSEIAIDCVRAALCDRCVNGDGRALRPGACRAGTDP